MSILRLVRGLPGSGKSTIAKEFGCLHLEADMYHMRDSEYVFDPKHIKQSHAWCFKQAYESLQLGLDVVVSNTFVAKWEIQPYLDLEKELGIKVVVITATGDYGNVHTVPTDVLDRMRSKWEEL